MISHTCWSSSDLQPSLPCSWTSLSSWHGLQQGDWCWQRPLYLNVLHTKVTLWNFIPEVIFIRSSLLPIDWLMVSEGGPQGLPQPLHAGGTKPCLWGLVQSEGLEGGVRGWSAPQSLYCLPATVADWPSSSYVYLLLHLNEGCLDRSAEGNGPNLQVCVHTFSSGKCFYFTLLWVRKHPTVEIRVFRLVFPRKYRIQTLEGHLIPSVSQQNTTEDQSVWKWFHHEDCQVK